MAKVKGLAGATPVHITEARRYIKNAKDLLRDKADDERRYYTDRKYVRMAGNTAWNGVLEALDGSLRVKDSLKKGQRPDVKDYQQLIGKRDQKVLKAFNNAYDTLHKVLGYDGNLNIKIVQDGLAEAAYLIDWCEAIS